MREVFPSLIIKVQSHAINVHDFLKVSFMIFLKEKKKGSDLVRAVELG